MSVTAALCGLGGPLRALCALPWPLIVAVGIIAPIAVVVLAERYITGVPNPPTIPLVCEPEGARRFSLRTRLAYYIDCKPLYEEAWDKVSTTTATV
jgi:hypothetical protein